MARSAHTSRERGGSSAGRRRLEVTYPSLDAFRREFEANLCKGGLFVPTEEPLSLRDEVEVTLDLAFRGERLTLEGEVVHQVGPELARAGAVPGVAVHFRLPAPELRARLEPVLREEGAARAAPAAGAQVLRAHPGRSVGGVEVNGSPDLAEAGLELGRILDVVPLPDAEVLEITRSLLERGLIRRLAPGAADPG